MKAFFRKKPSSSAVDEIYRKIVEQARQPMFYTRYGVPDTVDGRFELVSLHAFLVLRRLKRRSESASDLSQALFDAMFEDMDLSLREMGAGDMGVGKRVKAMVQAFYGRVASYEAGLSGDGDSMEDALVRNVYGTARPDADAVAAMAAYIRDQDAHLAATERADVESGVFRFGEFA